MEKSQEISACEVCGNGSLQKALDLGDHPLCDDLVPVGEDRICAQYPIEILFCESCYTAHQRFQVPKRILFPQSYHYRSRHTADVLNGMAHLVSRTEELLGGLENKFVVDIGCNDGSLLAIFREKGAQVIGVEPTGAWADAHAKKINVINDFFDPDVARALVSQHGNPDVITFTNVFAHIEDLSSLLSAVNILKKSSTIVVIENHYLGSVLRTNQFDTFYHEHPRTYSFEAFRRIANRIGMCIKAVDFPERYGGNIRVFLSHEEICKTEAIQNKDMSDAERSFGEDFKRLQNNIHIWADRKGKLLRQLARQYGPLPAKAFPGRSAIAIRLLGLDSETISAIYEKPLSAKVGHYAPGTRIPIVSDSLMLQSVFDKPVLVNLAWHISAEIRDYMEKLGYKGHIVDIISSDDFV